MNAPKKQLVLTNRVGIPDSHTLAVYQKTGGYSKALSKTFSQTPDGVIEEVKNSGLRGRGGAGFACGMKWSFVPKNTGKPTYLCVNADESEPGTFKDRLLLEKDPHQLIEGIIIACYAINCHTAYIYIRGEFDLSYKRIHKAIEEAYAQGILGKNVLGKNYALNVYIHRGAGAYICGEETALLESIEEGKGQPRIKPPFPAVVGLFGCPTIINNVETLSALPFILSEGATAYKKWGTEKSPGTKLFSVSGHIQKPGVYELPLGYSLKKLIEENCGGMTAGKKLKAVIPGGSSVPILTAKDVETMMLDYESAIAHGSMLGSGGVIVMNEDVDMVWALKNLTRFYAHESCGQCTPCREGTGWVDKILYRMLHEGGTNEDLNLLTDISHNMMGKTICVLADAMAMPVLSYIKKFPDDFRNHFRRTGSSPRAKVI
ncbi:MAG: NADH oxidoreductase (quinone) subunit F [Deltaproteobacteria bacterium RIFCSPLOWO2_12_FULL_40_28]|nr:MAG: NADH oxidoreductase (quinone) subunit F [Deltaproteobacteria bacterium RIFCSPHIGHO2_02_FULL_40_28]OGQ19907.1 MAG: NADH oxidoreductase (quinone) subunit F [Deltaproteobacteria bacterium RIFCSPHIGHO2_12_FULL_40_32]OGQ39666.1 MAG: NADH oxidoreductase (quinone) subunit F [Deltaproteobacteria bacterium RIFCSPLOWO2_02_FULL_40_36]OGQ52922.1 MAG: NADH oxidoreductase (quinone) subunit F [Deltaproteobacteria bacterium RIFCSPLOWO2_12_FULL_40_28]